MGMLLGTVVILWAGLTAGFGLYLQTRCARYLERGSASFFALSQITFPNASVIFDAAISIKCFGVAVSYLIIIGDLMPGVALGFSESAGSVSFLVDRKFWITAFMLVCIPLSFLRRLDSLKYTSIIALISISYLVVLILYHFGLGDTKSERGDIRYVETAGIVPILGSFPVVVFAYTCHQNMFSVLNEINDNSHYQTTSVVVASIGTAAFTYVLVAITGYLSFGNSVADNIVGQYAPSVASTVAKLAIVILVMFSYPLQVHPCRASVDAVIRWRPKRSQEASPTRGPLLPGTQGKGNVPRGDGMSDTRFAVISTVIIILSYIVAITVSSLSTVLAYVGSTGSTSISFILPGLFYYKISAPDSPQHQRLLKEDDDEAADNDEEADGEDAGLLSKHIPERARAWFKGAWTKDLLRKLSLALAIYGGVVMIVCLVVTTVFHVKE